MITIRPLQLRDIERHRPIPSGYVTDRVFRLSESEGSEAYRWELREEALPAPRHVHYDNGSLRELISTYEDGSPPSSWQLTGAFSGSDLTGFALWRSVEWNRTLWVMDIRVRAEGRRQGVGSALLAAVRGRGRSLGLRGIAVETQISNVPAIRFYRKHGFHLAGLNDSLYSNHDLHDQNVALFLFLPLG